jgi:hypothetical protein
MPKETVYYSIETTLRQAQGDMVHGCNTNKNYSYLIAGLIICHKATEYHFSGFAGLGDKVKNV